MKRFRMAVLLTLSCAALSPFAQSTEAPAASAGALLYQTHCIGCHDQKVHWRDRKLVTDWTSLDAQVRRWQANTGLRWSDANVEDVVRYLNSTIYKFPEQAPRQTG
jgi:mono/diheme cytochrome c family protein